MSIIEETKRMGAQTALWRAVDTRLWAAAKNCEEAKKQEGMRYLNFRESVAAARKCLEEAEQFFEELERGFADEVHSQCSSKEKP